jgi:hypothetical protein
MPLVERWETRRTDPRFWSRMDAAQSALARQKPTEAGLLDLDRYIDP